MEEEKGTMSEEILPVLRTREEARHLYDLLSKLYDYFTLFEGRYSEEAPKYLSIREGERALEIGFGTSRLLKQIAEEVGNTGKAYDADLSGDVRSNPQKIDKDWLVGQSRNRKPTILSLNNEVDNGDGDTTELYCGDALNLPYDNEFLDTAFMSFTLELFDTPEIPKLLEEVKRLLKVGGRLGVVGISEENGRSMSLRVCEWLHRKMPKYFGCRPIYVERSLRDSGYRIVSKLRTKMFSLPIEIVIAVKQ